MICPSNAGLLLEYASGHLDAGRAFAVAGHIRRCDACGDIVLGYWSVSGSLDRWQAPAVSMDFNRRLFARIEAANSAPWHSRLAEYLRFNSTRHLIPLAAAALVIASGLLIDRSHTSSQPAPHVSAAEADQAERTLDDIQLLQQFDAAVASSAPAKLM